MSSHAEVDEQIERLRKGNTLPENEVRVLCEKVRRRSTKSTAKGLISYLSRQPKYHGSF
jgi:hypothetical protein